KKYWLLPVFIVMAIFGGLIVLTKGTAVGPLIFTLFWRALRGLGVSAVFHDSAAALIAGGRLVAAAPERRFTRKKFDANYPRHAIEYCLIAGGITLADVDYVAFYDKPFEVRAPARNLSHLQAPRVPVIPHGVAVMAAAKSSSSNRCLPANSRRLNRISSGTNGLHSRSII